MAYVTQADIERHLGVAICVQLTDDDASGAIVPAVLDDARAAAEAEVNSFLASCYQTPVNTTDEPESAAMLRAVTLDITSYRLHLRKPPVPTDVVRRYAEALTWLVRVAAADVRLPAGVLLAESASQGVLAASAGPARTMTRDALENL